PRLSEQKRPGVQLVFIRLVCHVGVADRIVEELARAFDSQLCPRFGEVQHDAEQPACFSVEGVEVSLAEKVHRSENHSPVSLKRERTRIGERRGRHEVGANGSAGVQLQHVRPVFLYDERRLSVMSRPRRKYSGVDAFVEEMHRTANRHVNIVRTKGKCNLVSYLRPEEMPSDRVVLIEGGTNRCVKRGERADIEK